VARSAEFNTTAALALFAALLAAAARADEVRKWRDADGNLHYSITGTPGSDGTADEGPIVGARDPTAEEKFSIEASLRRRELERKLKAAGQDLEDVRRKLRETEGKDFDAWVPVLTLNPQSAQASLDAQRDAFLASTQFEQEKAATLRRLKRHERKTLGEIVGLWKEFDALGSEVRSRYGKSPDWWRDRLDCRPCPSAEEAAKALHPAAPPAEPQKTEKAASEDEDWSDEDWDDEDWSE
jgi:hypothetical protein